MDLKKFNVTVRCFNPELASDRGLEYVLPVDSPNEEHAISAAMSNAVAFTTKHDGDKVLPIAFCCIAIRDRS